VTRPDPVPNTDFATGRVRHLAPRVPEVELTPGAFFFVGYATIRAMMQKVRGIRDMSCDGFREQDDGAPAHSGTRRSRVVSVLGLVSCTLPPYSANTWQILVSP
jgi:hypothetical protein